MSRTSCCYGNTETGWTFFRADRLLVDSDTANIQVINGQKLLAFMAQLESETPVVAECLERFRDAGDIAERP